MLSELKVSAPKRHKHLLVPTSPLCNDTFPLLNQISGEKWLGNEIIKSSGSYRKFVFSSFESTVIFSHEENLVFERVIFGVTEGGVAMLFTY